MQYHHQTKVLLAIENSARKFFERFPFTHALLAGIGVVLFWRGVWESSDLIMIDPVASFLLGIAIMGGTGLFIQTFVGNTIIIKKVEKEINKEIEKEETTLKELSIKIDELNKKIDSLNKNTSL
jgi:hypothetical protein